MSAIYSNFIHKFIALQAKHFGYFISSLKWAKGPLREMNVITRQPHIYTYINIYIQIYMYIHDNIGMQWTPKENLFQLERIQFKIIRMKLNDVLTALQCCTEWTCYTVAFSCSSSLSSKISLSVTSGKFLHFHWATHIHHKINTTLGTNNAFGLQFSLSY